MKHRYGWVTILLNVCLVGIVLYLILSQLLPLNESMIRESTSNGVSVFCEMTNETVIEQPINIQAEDKAKINSFYIMVGNFSNRENRGTIRFQLKQNDTVSEVIVDIAKFVTDNKYYKIDFDYSNFVTGDAVITIQGIDVQKGSSIAFFTSEDAKEFGGLKLNGDSQDRSLIQKINYDVDLKITVVKTILFCVLIAVMLFSVGVIFIKKIKRKNLFLFVCSQCIIFLAFSIKYYSLIISPEPYAEQMTNFFYSASNLHFFQNLFMTDAGYLPFIQHLIAWVCIRVLNLGGNAVFLMNFTALLSLSTICALLNSRYLKILTAKARFFISILLPLMLVENYENLTFINFVYFGIVLIVFAIMVDLNELSRKAYIGLTVAIILCCLSKGFYVVIVPVAIIYLVLKNIKLTLRECILWLSVIVSAGVQLIYSFGYRDMWVKKEASIGVFDKLKLLVDNTILLYSKIFVGIFGVHLEKANIVLMYTLGVLFFIVTMVLPIYLYFIKKQKNRKYFILIILNMANLATCAFSALTLPYLLRWVSLLKNRHEIFMIITMFFTVIVAIDIIREYYRKSKFHEKRYINEIWSGVGIALICVVVCNTMFAFPTHAATVAISPMNEYSSWNDYGKYFEKDSCCIPIEPNGWVYCKNSTIYHLGFGGGYITAVATDGVIVQNKVKKIMDIQDKKKLDMFTLDDTIAELKNKEIVSVFVRRGAVYSEDSKCKMVLKDGQGNILEEVVQTNPSYKKLAGFMLETPIKNVHSIEFFDMNDNRVMVYPEFYIAVKN